MEEANLSKCRKCERIRLRRQQGYFPDGKNKRFLDEDGLTWNGRTCGGCHQSKVRSNMKMKREKEKNAVS